MPNPENLIGHEFTSDQNREEAAKNGRKGGKASGRARRQKKLLADCLNLLLERNYTNSQGQEMDGADLISVKLFQQAVDGDIRAFQMIRDTIGQQPVQRIESVEIPPETYAKVEEALNGEQ